MHVLQKHPSNDLTVSALGDALYLTTL